MGRIDSPFADAERYIQLRKQYAPQSWGDTILRFNELILTPLISLVLFFLHSFDVLSIVSTAFSTYNVWTEWTEYWTLRFTMQSMYLLTMQTGGPFIVTNDPTYMPYVYADAVVRAGMRHRGSATDRH